MGKFAKLLFQIFIRTGTHSSRNESTFSMFLYMMILMGCDNSKSFKGVEQEKKSSGGSADIIAQFEVDTLSIAYVFEVKYLKSKETEGKRGADVSKARLRKETDEALDQIRKKSYDQQFQRSNVIMRVGISFAAGGFVLGFRNTDSGEITYIDSDQCKE
jgi:PD-(D/E)XK nuclease superfamily